MKNGFVFQPRNPLLKLHIHRWAEKHRVSLGLAMAAQRLAVIAEPFHFIAHELRSRRVDARLPQRASAHEWLRMYRKHHEVWRQLSDLFPGPLGHDSQSLETLATDRALRRFIRDHPDEVKAWGDSVDKRRFWVWFRRAYRHAWRDYLGHLREAKELIDETDDGAGFDQMVAGSPALHFFLAVHLPCIVEYEMLPIALLRRARTGDERAIEQLLRLDDMAIDDPFIKQWRDHGTGEERRRKVELVAQWIRQGVGGQLSIQGVKQSLAGLIALFAMGMPKATDLRRVYTVKLDSGGIRELFNAVARDRGEGYGALQEDRDLFDLEANSWRQAVSKKKRAWLGGLPSSVRKTLLE